MKKYKVYYEYVVRGHCSIEAKNSKEASEIFQSSDDFGDEETVIRYQNIKVKSK